MSDGHETEVEYKVVEQSFHPERQLNAFAAEGWRVVAASSTAAGVGTQIVLEREVN